jgi:SAM-dependent methyltransferase
MLSPRRVSSVKSRRGAVVPSPNIWHWPEIYEVENRAQDVDGAIWAALRERVDLADADVVDIGCGDGFHLPAFATLARGVVGVEPHPPLVAAAAQRVSTVDNARVVGGRAQAVPLPDASVDVVHARTAYFFGPGCGAGLAEADRVLRPGGALVIVDLDGRSSPYGAWLCADTPNYRPSRIEEFFDGEGFESISVPTTWRFASRQELVAVLRIEFSGSVAAQAIAQTPSLEIPVGYRLRIRRKPTGLIRS